MRSCVLFDKEDMRVEDRPLPTLSASQVLVRFAFGGICGSDLHYFFQGANGAFKVRHPFVIGHEVSGTVAAVGAEVKAVAVGDSVAINPGIPCQQCHYCRIGRENLCVAMRFYGSASTMPHTDGAFQEYLAVAETQCCWLPSETDLRVAAMAEPLSVTLHALNRAGNLMGKSVLISGVGTIGALTVLAARRMGAGAITVSDVLDARLERAIACGATRAVNVSKEPLGDAPQWDVVIEASGSIKALNSAIDSVHKGGTIVQIGFVPSGEQPINLFSVIAKELTLAGTYRFGIEFNHAVDYLVSGLIDVSPLITHSYSVDDSAEAFKVAADGTKSVKVQLYFPG